MSWRKRTELSPWRNSSVLDTKKGPTNLGSSCIKWSNRLIPSMRWAEVLSGKTPCKKKWKLWILLSKLCPRARSHWMGSSMSTAFCHKACLVVGGNMNHTPDTIIIPMWSPERLIHWPYYDSITQSRGQSSKHSENLFVSTQQRKDMDIFRSGIRGQYWEVCHHLQKIRWLNKCGCIVSCTPCIMYAGIRVSVMWCLSSGLKLNYSIISTSYVIQITPCTSTMIKMMYWTN